MSKKKTKTKKKAKSAVKDQQKLIMGAGAGVVMAIFIGLIWFVYERVTTGGLDGELLLVEAPERPFKVEPENRGGLEVPHQEVRVFDRVSGEDNRADSELQQEAETPIALPEETAADLEPEQVTEEQVIEEEQVTEAPDLAPRVEAPDPVAEREDSRPAPTDRASAEAAFFLQLGVYSTRVSGETAWREMLASHGGVLGGLELVVERLRRTSGDLFLIKAVGFGTRQAADDACRRLKARGQDCLSRPNSAEQPAPSEQPASSPPAAPRGDFLVQLGVFNRRDTAEGVWTEALAAHSELVSHTREISELARASGTLYRLRFGDYATRAQADAVCNALKSSGRDCLVSPR